MALQVNPCAVGLIVRRKGIGVVNVKALHGNVIRDIKLEAAIGRISTDEGDEVPWVTGYIHNRPLVVKPTCHVHRVAGVQTVLNGVGDSCPRAGSASITGQVVAGSRHVIRCGRAP